MTQVEEWMMYKKVMFFALIMIGGGLLCVPVHADDDSEIDVVNVTVPVSCTLDGTGMNSHTAEINNHDFETEIGSTTLTAYCNDANGFSIYAIGYSDDTYGNTNLIGQSTEELIPTGTTLDGSVSDWAMKLSTTANATYPITLKNGYGSYSVVPTTYIQVAERQAATDVGTAAIGSVLTTTYAASVSPTQVADTYVGKVRYTLVHPYTEVPLQPQTTQAGQICYYPNGSSVEGSMGCQTISASDTSATLLASNFSRDGYGFAGWSKTFDYSDSTGFLGPQEKITFTAGEYSGNNNGLSLYAHWVKSEGNLQNWTCPNNTTMPIGTVKALTDQRDNETYAIAKLADGNCWMIENLRLDNSASLTLSNTNNPLNDGTNVTLKHSYSDSETHNTLSASQDPTVTAWCRSDSASCDDQSMLFTGNTTNRASSPTANGVAMYSYGNYYNWYSATAGRGTYSFSTNNNSVAGDLCPAGWHLPKGGNKSNEANNEFWSLVVTGINNGTNPANYESSTIPYYTGTPEGTNASNKLRAYPNNFVYSGYVDVVSVSVLGRGSYGGFWSSTAYSSSYAYNLSPSLSNVRPGTDSRYKHNGMAVRCVAPGV